ncbi:MAG: MiaB/RimO family radical SAM methylthiotransferase [Phycisphaerales bacterium]|nr:MiaB/RimO family radical SAM methylthiotransferase [Phycisphaerales bacterium]
MPLPVYLETFGCQMNELDSELVTSQLRTLGYRFTPDADAAQVVLFNTCSVRELAEQKVWSRLGELAIRKVRQPALVVGVLGCMAEREGEALLKRMPVVDILVGPGELDKLPGLLDNAVRTRLSLAHDAPVVPAELEQIPTALKKSLVSAGQSALQGNTTRRSSTLAAAADSLEMLDLSRATAPEDHHGSAYVRITRGCNKFCTYCVVPYTRGAEVHRPPEHILDECKRLADAGVIEITLLGQTVNHYRFEHASAVSINGIVQPQKGRIYKANEELADAYAGERVTTFADLLKRIHDEVPAIKRLRFVTSYPRSFGNDVLQVIRESPRICRYLHVPAQSGSNRMLQAMNRGYTVEQYLEFLDRARQFLHQPEINRPLTLAGDIIVGFPGETEEDHEATKTLLRKARYKNCFIFKYSPRPGTTAYDKLADDVPDEVKRRRNNELLALQQQISDEVGKEIIGRTLQVFVQGISKRQAKVKSRAAGSGKVALTIGGRSAEMAGDHAPEQGGACSVNGSHITTEIAGDENGRNQPEIAQFEARTDGDLIVHFDAPAAESDHLVGSIIDISIQSVNGLSLTGRRA